MCMQDFVNKALKSLRHQRLQPRWSDLLLWSVGRTGQGLVPRVDPGLSGLDGAGDQEDGVLSRIILPGGEHVHKTSQRDQKPECSDHV